MPECFVQAAGLPGLMAGSNFDPHQPALCTAWQVQRLDVAGVFCELRGSSGTGVHMGMGIFAVSESMQPTTAHTCNCATPLPLIAN